MRQSHLTPGRTLFVLSLLTLLLAILVGVGLSVAGATFQALLRNPLAEPYILGISSGGTVGVLQGKTFNLMATGEESALHLGVEVEQVKCRSYLLASLITGFTVSVGGIIGFVGLIVPHSCRLMFGPDHRLLLPASFVVGGIFMLICDLLSRTILAPSEIPVDGFMKV